MTSGRLLIPGVDGSTSFTDAAPLLLSTRAEPLFAVASRADIADDAGAVHDLRVATRRVREALQVVHPVYPAKPAARWNRRLRRLTRTLGVVREADVALSGLAQVHTELDVMDARVVVLCIGLVAGRRDGGTSALRQELARSRLAERRRAFERFAARPSAMSGAPTLGEAARTQIATRVRDVVRAIPGALEPRDARAQHSLRIEVKHLRYAYEMFAPAMGDGFDARHRFLTRLQDALGDLHDAHVLDERVVEAISAPVAATCGLGPDDALAARAVLSMHIRSAYERFGLVCDEHPVGQLGEWLLEPLT